MADDPKPRGRRRAGEPASDPRARSTPGRRPGPKHAAKEPATPGTPKAPDAPDAPRIGPSSAPGAASARRTRTLVAEARNYADRAAYRGHGARPTITGRAAAGAAGGAATGAAIGSAVPGVGTAVGAGAGAVVGGVGGGLSGRAAKKAAKLAQSGNGRYRKALVAEFAVCLTILGLSPLTDKHRDEPPGAFMKRGAALLGLFFVLGIISAGGRAGARVASGFGAVVAVSLALSQRDLFVKLAERFSSTNDRPTEGPGMRRDADDIGSPRA